MDYNSVYAVVDLETTGTKHETDKIIQFACVFVQHNKIINELSIDINPDRSIPVHISHLTNIYNSDVSSAPYFEDVAVTIRNMLEGTVFVAHNVNFDFHFLNSELKRAGELPLTNECLDTVELFQILYPTSLGFRVSDMATILSIEHENPHQALSDAWVTSHGLIKMIEKALTFPKVTLRQLSTLSTPLGANNNQFFDMIYKEKEIRQTENKNDIDVINGLALKRKTYFKSQSMVPIYDRHADNHSVLRKPQKEMIERIHTFIKEDEHQNFLIEAETGVGKTLAYLFGTFYGTEKRPILISTSTVALQHQLQYHSIPFFNKISREHAKSVILKSYRNYLSLSRFYQTLSAPSDSKNYTICQMATLCWLLETTTGDLDELNVNKQSLFYSDVSYSGFQSKSPSFEEFEFVNHLQQQLKAADFIIVNHAYLLTEHLRYKHVLPSMDTVILDEAHKLPTIMEEISTTQFSFASYSYVLDKLIELYNKSNLKLYSEYDEYLKMSYQIVLELREVTNLLEIFIMDQISKNHAEQIVNIVDWYEQSQSFKRQIEKQRILTKELEYVSEMILNHPLVVKSMNSAHYEDWIKESVELSHKIEKFLEYPVDGQYRWTHKFQQRLVLSMFDFNDMDLLKYNWYQEAFKVIYTSGTLQLDIENNHFENRLQLEGVSKFKIPSLYQYDKQAKCYVIQKPQSVDIDHAKQFSKYIVKSIRKLYDTHHKTILVLFTSHELLKLTYESLKTAMELENVQILGQGISGTQEKILKKMEQSPVSIVLGASTFWEGIDFNQQSIDIVMITRLPFDPPMRPNVKARYDFLKQNGKEPFSEDALPQVGLRIRQGIGRLIRNPKDQGILIFMDERIVESRYYKTLQSYLPEDLVVEHKTLKDIIIDSSDFFTKKELD